MIAESSSIRRSVLRNKLNHGRSNWTTDEPTFSCYIFCLTRLRDCSLIISIGNGGIRELSSLSILQNIMEKIPFIDNLSSEPLPCDYFDMICGTSNGGYPHL